MKESQKGDSGMKIQDVLMAFSWSSSWINVEYGAEAMNESEQDPPKSGVDLVGAW